MQSHTVFNFNRLHERGQLTSDICVISSYLVPDGQDSYSTPARAPAWLPKVLKNHVRYCKANQYDYIFRPDTVELPSSSKSLFYRGANSKPHYILQALELGYKSIFWMDPDSLFCRYTTNLSDLAQSSFSLLASGDIHEILNAGHLFFNSSQHSLSLLNAWINLQKLTFQNCKEVSFDLTAEGHCVSDNTLLVALLAHGYQDITPQSLVDSFNQVNGYHRNPYANLDRFNQTHRFYSEHNIRLPNPSLASCFRENVSLLPQRRLNSYVLYGDHYGHLRTEDPIVHFVGPDKFLLTSSFFYIIYQLFRSAHLLFLLRALHQLSYSIITCVKHSRQKLDI